VLVALPVFQFLFFRGLFRWAIWTRVLWGLSRLRLRLATTHPDRRAGLGFLKLPSLAFCAAFLLGTASVLCAAWGTQVLHSGARVREFRSPFIVFVVLGELLAFGPLFPFMPRLFNARQIARAEYGGLATDYSRRLYRRWIEPKERPDPLGSADFQSLTDLGQSYADFVDKMTVLLFAPRDLVLLFAFMASPVIPLLLLELPLHELLLRLAQLFFGSIPK
jgi:hypothetical protein